MPRTSLRKKLLLVGVAGLAGLACYLGVGGSKNHAKLRAQASQEQATEKPGRYLGSSYCAQCHEEKKGYSNEYVLLNEYKTWLDQDKHSQAYKKLTEARAQRMGQILQIADVTKDNRCINCHAANVPKELRYEPEDPENKRRFKIEDGVSCDACHGASEKWIGPHSLEDWRTKPMEQKEALGMRDVRDPIKRSQLCFSCHIGNMAEGKVVTHEMYAAGHPPLPGIEVATFSDKMPRHWRYRKEKSPKIQKLLQKVLKIDPGEHEQTKLVVVCSVVALRSAAELLAAQTDVAAQAQRSWPELANFDCFACHHDLKTPSWRQQRGYPGTAGRPQMRTWPTTLVRLAIQYGGQDTAKETSERFHQSIDQLSARFNAQPFGKPGDIHSSAAQLVKWSDDLVKQVSKSPYDQAASIKLLRELCTLATAGIPDYDSARQVAWAFQIIYGGLDSKPNQDAKIRDILKRLNDELKVALPSGTGRQILSELADALEKIAEYNPDRFREAFKELSKLLPQQ